MPGGIDLYIRFLEFWPTRRILPTRFFQLAVVSITAYSLLFLLLPSRDFEALPSCQRLYLWGISRCSSLLLNLYSSSPISRDCFFDGEQVIYPPLYRPSDCQSARIQKYPLTMINTARDMGVFCEKKSCSQLVRHIKGSIWCPLLQRFLFHSKLRLWCVDLTHQLYVTLA